MSYVDIYFLWWAQVDDYQNTNVDGVYAVGDACDKKVGSIRVTLLYLHFHRRVKQLLHALLRRVHAACQVKGYISFMFRCLGWLPLLQLTISHLVTHTWNAICSLSPGPSNSFRPTGYYTPTDQYVSMHGPTNWLSYTDRPTEYHARTAQLVIMHRPAN